MSRRPARGQSTASRGDPIVAVVGLAAGAGLLALCTGAVLAIEGHTESAERAIFVLAFAVALPGSVAVARARRLHVLRTVLGSRSAQVGLAVLGAGAIVSVAVGDLSGRQLALAVLVGAGLALAFVLAGIGEVRSSRALDALTALIILLLATDLSLRLGDDGPSAFAREVIWTHQGHYLGPANEVVNGGAMLVDTLSIYGVGVFYALAAWFALAPIGYPSLVLLSSVLTGLQLIAVYAALRAAGCSRSLCIIALSVALVASLYALSASAALLPSVGGLRYGPAYLLALLSILGARPGRGDLWRTRLGVLAVSSLWSVETFVCALAVFVAAEIATAAIAVQPRGPSLGRRLAAAALACAGAHLAFGLATLAGTGEWPDWLAYLGDVGRLAQLGPYSVTLGGWSGPLALGLALFASAVVLGAMLSARSAALRSRPVTAVAIAVLTALGAAASTYLVSRSVEEAVPPFLLPAIALAALWVSLGAEGDQARRAPRLAAIGLGALAAAGLLVNGAERAGEFLPRTALARVLPGGGESLAESVSRGLSSAPLDPQSATAAGLAEDHARGSPTVFLLRPVVEVEASVLLGEARPLPVPFAFEVDQLADRGLERVLPAVDALPSRTLLVSRADALATGSGLLPLQQRILERLRLRFELRPVARGPHGLGAWRLVRGQARISASTSSRLSVMCRSERRDSRLRRSSGSVFEARTLKCQSS